MKHILRKRAHSNEILALNFLSKIKLQFRITFIWEQIVVRKSIAFWKVNDKKYAIQ